ncbi:MAG: 30S ribosomal protein S7 [Candidatus Vogelbacteria bacterium]|nr:30S ribosomal protein S7 [Candidatus Vogelbacteria bacterium]
MRRKIKINRQIQPDLVFRSLKVAKFINHVMRRGKKSVARRAVYDSFAAIKEKTKSEPLEVFETALKNVGPHTELKSRRVGGANYQIPHEVNSRRRLTLAMRWILEAARSKSGRPMSARLADELVAASQNQGEAIKKRENVHKMAEANRAFAHFARPAAGGMRSVSASAPRPVR